MLLVSGPGVSCEFSVLTVCSVLQPVRQPDCAGEHRVEVLHLLLRVAGRGVGGGVVLLH